MVVTNDKIRHFSADVTEPEIIQEIQTHNNCDDNFQECLIRLVDLVSSAGNAFKGSTAEEKRDLINYVFANLTLNR